MGLTPGRRLVRALVVGTVGAGVSTLTGLCALAVPAVSLTVPTATPTSATSSTPGGEALSPPNPPSCANAVQVVVDDVTSAPSPLPRPTSTVGGARLSAQGLQVDAPAGVPAPPVLAAAGWVVADLTSGAVLAACNAHVPFLPASTLKVLTALALAPAVDREQTYVALPADAAVDGTKVGLSPGSTYSGDDLFHALLMASGNDAASALADLAGGPAAASTLMTREARRLGALDTVPVNTSGLDAAGQVSSAYDLALFARAALERPYLTKIMKTRAYDFPGKGVGNGPRRARYQIQNHNRLLGSYDGATGVKNGYTVAAGGSFIGSATRDGRSYVAVLLRADGRTSEMAGRLLDWAFANGSSVTPVGRLVTPQEVVAGQLTDPPSPTGTPAPVTPSRTAGATPPSQAGAGRTAATTSPADAWAAATVLGVLVVLGTGGLALVGLRRRRGRSPGRRSAPDHVGDRPDRTAPDA